MSAECFATLSGMVAVVTGSSSGIGRAIALELAAAGADVLVHARQNESAAGEVAEQVRATGQQANVILCDLAETGNHELLVEHAFQWQGRVQVWVNNAGADVLTGAAANWSFDEKLAYLWRVDVRATIRLARLVGRRIREQAKTADQPESSPVPAGVILNVGWDQAQEGMGGDSGEMFAASKGAIMSFSQSLAKSLAPYVRVNCLAPGWIKTAWAGEASAYWDDRARRESLLQRWGQPEDVAHLARFLASPQAGFINGQTVAVNGGLSAP